MADTTSADRYIRIGSYLLNTVSRFYEVESIIKVDANSDNDFEDNDDYYDILLKKPFDNDINFNSLVLLSVFLSFIFSYIAIKYFLIFVRNFNFNIFIIYRIILSLFIFYIIYS